MLQGLSKVGIYIDKLFTDIIFKYIYISCIIVRNYQKQSFMFCVPHCICFKHATLSDHINLLDFNQTIFFNFHIFHKPYPSPQHT